MLALPVYAAEDLTSATFSMKNEAEITIKSSHSNDTYVTIK